MEELQKQNEILTGQPEKAKEVPFLMKCRVCDSELQEGAMICPNCGRMVVSFSEPLPETLQQCLVEERSFYEQQMASGGELQHELGERKAKIDVLNTTVAMLQAELEQKRSELEVLNKAKLKLESDNATLKENYEKKVKECEANEARACVLEKEKALLFYEICEKCHSPYRGGEKQKFCLECGNERPKKPKD
jgi:hypothetical protein